MFRRLQNILCCVVIAGFAAVCWYGKNNGEAVMTGGAVKTTMDKPVVVIDPGHGGVAVSYTHLTLPTNSLV